MKIVILTGIFLTGIAFGGDYNALILETIAKEMPKGGIYAKYRKDLPEGKRLDDLQQTVADLDKAIEPKKNGELSVTPKKAKGYSFCSSATFLAFAEVTEQLIEDGKVPKSETLSRDLAWTGSKEDVTGGKLDGVGIFGHWNADGPGTAMLFKTLDLGPNFSDYAKAKPGDFMKIFWNENIGKGERGHLVVYLGDTDGGKSVKVWSSQTENDDGSSGYGVMTVEKSRIKRVVFSRLTKPENLANWVTLPESQKSSAYLIRIRKTGSSGEEMAKVVGLEN
ncbi:MAG: hypothetical protein ACKVJU_02310 [Verrucomicrobiales bacterium]